jgi:hypothetical protein
MSPPSWYTNPLATEEPKGISMSPSSPTNMPTRIHAAAVAEKKQRADAAAKEARKQVDAALTKLTDICIHAMTVYTEATDTHTKAINAKRLAQLRKDKAVLVNNVANTVVPKIKDKHLPTAKTELEASKHALSNAEKLVTKTLQLQNEAYKRLTACRMQDAYTKANEEYYMVHKRMEGLERIAKNALQDYLESAPDPANSAGGRKRKTAKPRKPTKKRASR